MKKSDLVKLIEKLGDDDSVLETLKGVEGLSQSQFDATKLTIDDYKTILEKNEGIKGYATSSLDSAINKAIDSHDKKFNAEKLPTIIEQELKKRSNEGKSEIEIKYEEMQKEIENMKTEKARSEMSSKYTKTLAEKGLDVGLIDFVLGQDDTSTETNIEKLSGILSNLTENKVKEKLNNSSYVPPKNDTKNFGKPLWDDVVKGTVSYEQYKESTLKAD